MNRVCKSFAGIGNLNLPQAAEKVFNGFRVCCEAKATIELESIPPLNRKAHS